MYYINVIYSMQIYVFYKAISSLVVKKVDIIGTSGKIKNDCLYGLP